MTKQNNQEGTWNAFYDVEKEFFNFVDSNSKLRRTLNDCEAKYSEITVNHQLLPKPPETIRQIYQIDAKHLPTIRTIKNRMEKLFTAAMNEDNKRFKRFPARFPKIIEAVDSISIQSNDAYSSFVVVDQYVPISRFFESNNCQRYVDSVTSALKNFSIKTKVNKAFAKCNDQDTQATYIYADGNDLNAYFKVSAHEQLRCRRLSGTQYRALIHAGGEKPTRSSLGYLICSGDFDINMSKAAQPRSHKTAESEQIRFEKEILGQYVEFYIEHKDL